MSLPLNDIQKTLYGVLTAGLAPVLVTDSAGPNMPYPFVVIGQFSALRNDTLDVPGTDVAVVIDAYSQQDGSLEVQAILERIYDLLHRKSFPLPRCQWVSTMLDYVNMIREPDGLTRHGVIRFLVLTFDVMPAIQTEERSIARTLDEVDETPASPFAPSGRRIGRTLDE